MPSRVLLHLIDLKTELKPSGPPWTQRRTKSCDSHHLHIQTRYRIAYATIPQTSQETPGSTQSFRILETTYIGGEDPIFPSRQPGRVTSFEYRQWAECQRQCEPEAQARQSGYARCISANGIIAVHDLQPSVNCGPSEYTL